MTDRRDVPVRCSSIGEAGGQAVWLILATCLLQVFVSGNSLMFCYLCAGEWAVEKMRWSCVGETGPCSGFTVAFLHDCGQVTSACCLQDVHMGKVSEHIFIKAFGFLRTRQNVPGKVEKQILQLILDLVETQDSSPRQLSLLPDAWPDGRGKVLNILFCASLARSKLTDLYSTRKLDFKVPLGVLKEGSWPNEKIILWYQHIM